MAVIMKPTLQRALLLAASISFTSLTSAQVGDTCGTPVVISGTGTYNWDNTLNTTSGFDGGDPATCFSPANAGTTGSDTIRQDVFFAWTVPTTGNYIFDTENSIGIDDTKMSIHLGSDCSATCVASDDDGGSVPDFSSLIQLTGLTGGDQYLIQVGSWNDTSDIGDALLNITHLIPPTNDDCSTPQVISGLGTFNWDNSSATTSGFDGGNPTGCFSPANTGTTGIDSIRKDLFFAWTVPAGGGDYQFDTEFSPINTDTKMSIHTGADCSATCLASDDDGGVDPVYSSKIVLYGLTGGDQYLIQVGSWNDSSPAGDGFLNVSLPPATPANDLCSTATAISGSSTWAFDTSTASTSGFNGASSSVCNSGALDMGGDVFFQWTAPSAGDYRFDTCGSLYDTKLTTHLGLACASTCGAHNDDGVCGSGASEVVLLGLSAGDLILVQLGGWNGLVGSGILNIAPWADPCGALGPDAFEENDTCATAQPIIDGAYPGLTVFRTDLDIYSLTVPAGGTLDVLCNHNISDGDIDLFLFDSVSCEDDPSVDPTCAGSLACGWSSVAPESLTWINATGADVDCTLRVSLWPSSAGDCVEYELIVTGADAGGPDLFCDPASTNSSGTYVTLGGSTFSGPGVFHLEATDGPVDQFGYFLVSATSTDPGITVSTGQLCLGAPIGRYNPNSGPGLNSIGRFDVGGVFQNLGGTSSTGAGFDLPSNLPSPPGGLITSGSTWHFQLWYRDLAGTSNFSNGLSVSF